MSTHSQFWPDTSFKRRTLLLLLVATLALVAALIWQRMQPWQQPPTPSIGLGEAAAALVNRYEIRIAHNPDDAAAYALLGQSLLQQVRITGDVSQYVRAEQAFEQALALDPQHLEALIGQGMLALVRHEFADAISWADQAWAINPFRAQILGIKVDALVELGDYAAAIDTLQAMVDLRPDNSAYTRISYLRELYGETINAEEALQRAASMVVPGSEEWLWTTVQLGHLAWQRGQFASAGEYYQQALAWQADYPYALAGLGRVEAAQGDLAAAIARYETLVERLPLPEFVITLGELYGANGQVAEANQQFALVETMQRLNAAAGMKVDLELATFMVNHGGDVQAALQLALAAYETRPTIYAADTLAWAYYHVGDYANAAQFSREARRLDTQDAMLFFHAGMIAKAQGNHAEAKRQLQQARALNPYFSFSHAAELQQALEQTP